MPNDIIRREPTPRAETPHFQVRIDIDGYTTPPPLRRRNHDTMFVPETPPPAPKKHSFEVEELGDLQLPIPEFIVEEEQPPRIPGKFERLMDAYVYFVDYVRSIIGKYVSNFLKKFL